MSPNTKFDNDAKSDLPIPPGDYIREMLEERGWSQTELARRMERPVTVINQLVNGKKAITAETALQLEKVLGMSAKAWMALESEYRLTLARTASPAQSIYNEVLDAFVLEKDSDRATWVRKFLERVSRTAAISGESGSRIIRQTLDALNTGDVSVAEWQSNTPKDVVREFTRVAEVVGR